MARVIKDRAVLGLCAAIIEAEAGSPQAASTQSADAPPGGGLPIGNLTSQHFANFDMGWLNHFVLEECAGP